MGLSLPRLAILQPAPLHKRLWQGGVALLVLVVTLAAGNFFVADDKAVSTGTLGHDFLAFYTAGTQARTGEFEKLYNLSESKRFQHGLREAHQLQIDDSFAPYWNPPFYAWFTAPFSMLSYHRALLAWTIFNLACLAGAIVLMIRMLPKEHSGNWRIWGLIPLLILTSMPFVQAIGHGQNTFLSLLLLSAVITAWRKPSPVVAGMICGLLFYKPQLAAVVAGMLVLTLGARVCVGLGFVVGLLLLLTGATMPDALGNFLSQLPLNLRQMQIESTYVWDRHATLRGFWRLLYQGKEPAETLMIVNVLTVTCMTMIGSGLIFALVRMRTRPLDDCWTGETRSVATDRMIVATIISMPLLMPFYFDYDLLLLAVPAVLTAGEVLMHSPGARMDRLQRLLAGSWIGLYAWLMINPPMAAGSRVNVAVVILGAMSGFAIARAAGREARAILIGPPEEELLDIRVAA